MIEVVFTRIMPIISFILGVFMFYKFWQMRSLMDKQTIRLIKQVKSMWGASFGTKSGEVRATSANYKSATTKVGKKIKSLVPFGLLDELTDAEVHSYLMNEDTMKFFLKARELFGGEWSLPGMPQIGQRKAGVPEMRRE